MSQPTFLNVEWLFYQVYRIFGSGGESNFTNGIKVFFSILSIFFITVIAYCIIRMFEIRKKEHHHMMSTINRYLSAEADTTVHKARSEWEAIQDHLASESDENWRLAIIEADRILESLMEEQGFLGDTLGDKLDEAGKVGKIVSIPKAWEAHKVRNQIAHEGMSFNLSKREATRVLGLYEDVFKELGYL